MSPFGGRLSRSTSMSCHNRSIPFIFVAFQNWPGQTNSPPFPPGSPMTLISGNLHQLQRIGPALVRHMKWVEKYDPIFPDLRVHAPNHRSKSVIDLPECKPNIYSDRPVVWDV
ncbi:hypothetical protein E1B28_009140 [Marasmius oreades]|uniref:Uncharacterized protein n=1 Tax=Marasmius oreades TaxID=181124 RepID=A0A9P7UT36_9AGAR|nr:uncharacterized protein E1B28_009140 [Marasmius oreades]KAG7092825.1 hypothetical protein E1B28_009140 [Marasmius oreades]